MAYSNSRRKFLGYAGLSSTGILFGNALTGWSEKRKSHAFDFDLMEEVL